MEGASDDRQDEIERQLGDCERWLEPFRYEGYEVRLPLFKEYTFARGFIERTVVPEMMFFLFAPAVRDLGMVRHLELDFDETEPDIGERLIDRLVVCMAAPRLRSLHWNSILDAVEEIEALAAWPGVAELTELHGILFHDFDRDEDIRTDDVVRALARSPYLTNLRSLELNLYPGYSDAAIDAVLESPTLARLERLRLLADDEELSEAALARYRARFGEEHPDNRG
jgi:hypothetical protein